MILFNLRLRDVLPALLADVGRNLWHIVNGGWWCPECGAEHDRPPLKRHGLPGDRVCECANDD